MEETAVSKICNFASHYRLVRFKKGEIIIRPGDNPSVIYYIKSGVVRKYALSRNGTELAIFIHKEGAYFPQTKLINVFPDHYYYEAMNSTELYAVPAEEFEKFIQSDAQLGYTLFLNSLTSSYNAHKRIEQLLLGNATQRLAAVLNYLAEDLGIKNGNSYTIKLWVTQQKLATMASLTRETVSVEMEKMHKNGLIFYNGKEIVIPNIKTLQKECDDFL